MKLNYKKTILVGFAFFVISAFWGAYDAIVPLLLKNKFQLADAFSGFIMSLDNLLAVFLLPLFGTLSDKVKGKYGRRTPFIVFGTLAAVLFFNLLGFIDNLPLFICVLLLVLLSMATFRSPAVALMPDVTVKPLRSKANAIINLTGTAGAILVLALGIVFKTSESGKTDFRPYIAAVTLLMTLGLLVFVLTVRERHWAAEMRRESAALGIDDEPEESGEKRALTRGELTSLLLILASVALWYIGYNSVTSKYSVYATTILGVNFNTTLMVAQAAAIISYIPVGFVASKIGRKKTILAGIIMLTAAFITGIFMKPGVSEIIMFPIFALAGIGWATINVNSFPMVVELAKEGDVGKYTGYYYTASMAAQIIAPTLSGVLYDLIGMDKVFFPFAAIFVCLSFVTMLFVRHGDSKPQKTGALESIGAAED